MIIRSVKEIADMVGGRIRQPERGGQLVKGVFTDTRNVLTGGLFVPLTGERFNGHRFVADALLKGAAVSFWQEDEDDQPMDATLIYVDDPLLALQRLASAYRKTLSTRIVAVTGSNGKTSTKDILAAMLAGKYRVHKTKGNLNNHIGVPLMLLQLSPETEIAVLEMGMSARGEIALLSHLAQPEAAIITMIGESHLEHLGSRLGIAEAKMEIIEGLQPNGLLVLPKDEPLLDDVLHRVDLPLGTRVLRIGDDSSADYFAQDIHCLTQPVRMKFQPVLSGSSNPFPQLELSLLGKHHVRNAMTAFAMAKWLGLRSVEIIKGLAQLQMTAMRSQVIETHSGWTIINDAYNASPSSVRAAILALRDLSTKARNVVILGDMLELGEDSAALHAEIGAFLNPKCEHVVFSFGNDCRHLHREVLKKYSAEQARHFETKAALLSALSDVLLPGDWVLVKGSRGMKMEEVVTAMQSVVS